MIRLSSMTSISDNLNSIPNTIAPIVHIPNSVSMHGLTMENHHKPSSNIFFKVPDYLQKLYSVSSFSLFFLLDGLPGTLASGT